MELSIDNENLKFLSPLDQTYSPFSAYANGRDIHQELHSWELRLDKNELILSNEVGASYNLGALTEDKLVRVTLTFFQFETPYFALEYSNGVTRLFKYNLVERELTYLLELTHYKNLSLFYSRAVQKDKIMMAAILPDEGVVLGEFDVGQATFNLDLTKKYSNTEQLRIHRFGITVTNQLKIEVASLDES